MIQCPLSTPFVLSASNPRLIPALRTTVACDVHWPVERLSVGNEGKSVRRCGATATPNGLVPIWCHHRRGLHGLGSDRVTSSPDLAYNLRNLKAGTRSVVRSRVLLSPVLRRPH